MPVRLLPVLRKRFKQADFASLDPTENLPEEKHFILIDTVINADKVTLLTDIDSLASQPRYSLHDCDLGFNLKLMKKLGTIKRVTVIGLPPSIGEEQALEELEAVIPSLLSGNG